VPEMVTMAGGRSVLGTAGERSAVTTWEQVTRSEPDIVVVAPWLLRQLDVFGSIAPSSVGGRILFITEYRELYSVSSTTTLDSFLAQGLGPLLASRLGGLWDAFVIFVVSPMMVLLVPLLVIGTWVCRRDRDFAPWVVYAVTLFTFTAVVSAVHVSSGTFIHSAVALLPHAYLLVMVGVSSVVSWVARHRPGWNAPVASRNIGFMLVAVIVVVGALSTLATVRAWEREADSRTEILATLAQVADPGDIVMSPDAGAYQYRGDWAGIITPDDPLPVVEDAMRRYRVRWLVLEGDHITEALRPLLAGEERPDWLSAPLISVRPLTHNDEAVGADEPLPRAALFAVCLGADDGRCGP